MQDLNTLIEKANRWCEENSVIPIKGAVLNRKYSVEVFVDEDLEIFLDLAKSNGVKHLVIESNHFILDEHIKNKFDNYDSDDLAYDQVKSQLVKAAEFEGKVEYLSISWFKEGVSYSIIENADWIEIIETEILEIIQKIEIEKSTSRANRLLFSEKLQKRLAHAVASNQQYLMHCTRPKLLDKIYWSEAYALDSTVSESDLFTVKRMIQSKVERIFDRQFRGEAENILATKIREMAENSTKKEILARLDITESLYERLK